MTGEFSGSRVLVIGMGVSGCSAANFCAERGARVTAADERPEGGLPHAAGLRSDVERRCGAPLPDAADFDWVVPSPGVPRARYKARARKIVGDIELAGQALKVPIAAVTGTNGKSTCVRLLEAMLRSAGLRARAAGNLGVPALSLVGRPLDAAVLEVSSFQLESVTAFQPAVAIILNLSPDHLDRHGDLERYAATKQRLIERQVPDDVAVLNFDDPRVRAMAGATRARLLPFSRRTPLDPGTTWDGSAAVLCDGNVRRRVALSQGALSGSHNLENILAALTAAWALGADPERAAAALIDFRGLPHRCEVVGRGRGVVFVNDSKATNPQAAIRCLESLSGSLLWIAGGRDKDLDFDRLADAVVTERVRRAYLIGEAAEPISRALAGRVPVCPAATLDAAVEAAAGDARPGEVVVLSPACASFDQFGGFEERGERFRAAATRWLAREHAP